MPLYSYRNTITDESIDVVQGMNDPHEYFGEDGVKWQRIYTLPQSSIDTKIDPFSQNAFVNKTASMKGSIGSMMDLSSELSDRRSQTAGQEDPVKRKHFDDYKNKVGKKHLQDYAKKLETKHAIIDFTE